MNLADWTRAPTLDGAHARIEPLQMAHIDGLRGALGDGSLSKLWYVQMPTAKTMTQYVQAALAAQAEGKVLPFAVLNADGQVVGTTRYYNLDADVPRLSIGYTWYGETAQRTGINTETKLMLLTHAFERLECISVGFETSSFNAASRAAIARLGAKQDGVLRNHKRHPDGTPRDTVIFSIIDTEWQDVKRHLQARLDAHA